jgi:hypothetical protein
VWNKQPEHQCLNGSKIIYNDPYFVDYEDVKELAYNHRILKSPSTPKKESKQRVKKEVLKKKELVEIIITLLF